jgi:hypothetical protein
MIGFEMVGVPFRDFFARKVWFMLVDVWPAVV